MRGGGSTRFESGRSREPRRAGRRRADRALALLATLLAAAAARADDPFLRRTAAVQAVQSAGPAVVNVTTEQVARQQGPFRPFAGDPLFDRFFQDFFEPRAPQTAQSLGSGVVIDAERHVLTNEHVISGASRIVVATADGREIEASVWMKPW